MNTLSSGHAASDSGDISTINGIESKALTSVAKNSPATPLPMRSKSPFLVQISKIQAKEMLFQLTFKLNQVPLAVLMPSDQLMFLLGPKALRTQSQLFPMLFLEEYVQ